MYFLSLPRSNLKDGSTGLVESARLDKWIWQGLAGGPGGVGACCAGNWESWALLRASMAACCPPRHWACGGSWADAQHSPGPAQGESGLSLRHCSSLKARLLSAVCPVLRGSLPPAQASPQSLEAHSGRDGAMYSWNSVGHASGTSQDAIPCGRQSPLASFPLPPQPAGCCWRCELSVQRRCC